MTDCFHVDAFTAVPFAGNPAAVCVLAGQRSDSWMQGIASEMNLSETAFLRPEPGAGEQAHRGNPATLWSLRWFTPLLEVDLCGHATLASAHVLWQSDRVPAESRIEFSTRSGPLTAWQAPSRSGREKGSWIELDFPRRQLVPCEPPEGLIEGLGVMPLRVGRSEEDDLLVEVADGETLRGITPDQGLLGAIEARGVVVTCRGEGEYDFLSRFFAPASGVLEDPVTGSAHCCLGPYWSRRLGKRELLAFQASRRGGVVRVRIEGQRVVLGGQAVTVARGRLEI